jgi:peptidoglycan/LPS O-acetylase OafA/YrhL
MAATAAVRSTETTSRFYRPELDVLRFGAFGMVFLAHAMPHPPNLPPALRPVVSGIAEGLGFGVDVFFLLSSYLITELLQREYWRTGGINVRAFWIRRILRIWPLYFAFLAFAVWIVPLLLPQNFPLFHRMAYATFWGNFALIADQNANTVAGSLWSVSIEEQFYLLWPLVLSRYVRNLKGIAIGLLVVSSLTRALLAANGASDLWAYWANTPARLDPIAAGALLALFLKGKHPRISQAWRVPLLASGFCLIVVCGVLFPRVGWRSLAGYPLATVAALLLLLGILGAPWQFPKILIYLGRISYGLYVFHVLALRLVSAYVPAAASPLATSLIRFAASLGLTIALAAISYRWLEAPFLKLKDRFSLISTG